MHRVALLTLLTLLTLPPLLPGHAALGASFVNWEIPHVHPLDITPDGNTLLAVNTADNRLEIFDLASGTPVPLGSVPVGLRPVAVRARSDGEAWVVNHISDSVSIVDLSTRNVRLTLGTLDEPADVIFANDRAVDSCSQANVVQVFDALVPESAPASLDIGAEEPREMAVSACTSSTSSPAASR